MVGEGETAAEFARDFVRFKVERKRTKKGNKEKSQKNNRSQAMKSNSLIESQSLPILNQFRLLRKQSQEIAEIHFGLNLLKLSIFD